MKGLPRSLVPKEHPIKAVGKKKTPGMMERISSRAIGRTFPGTLKVPAIAGKPRETL